MKKVITFLHNKYFLAVAAFTVWMVFFDRNDVFSQLEYARQLHKFKEEKAFYTKECAEVRKNLTQLNTNLHSAEQFAREKYFMKKDNEDVFMIIKNQERPGKETTE